jgi:hypothetical protein
MSLDRRLDEGLDLASRRDPNLRHRRCAVPEQDHRQGCNAARIGQNFLIFELLNQRCGELPLGEAN